MQSILGLLQSVVDYAVPMIVLLGLLIFVHELGHFLVAKYFKVRVEVFSLGFGPKLLKYKRGDTVYALSLIPFGGYVKMFGDDPTATVDEAQRAVSFNHKPVGQRIAVVLAGPLMNLFFAILVFSGASFLGEQLAAPNLGDVDEKTPAYAAGFRSGDHIIAVDGQAVQSWDEFQKTIDSNPNQNIRVTLERDGAGLESRRTIDVKPKSTANSTPLSWDSTIGEIEGVSMSSKSTFIGVRDPQSPAGLAGFKTGDHIKSVNGIPLTKWRELLAALGKWDFASKLEIEVERGLLDEKTSEHPETVKASIQLPTSIMAMGNKPTPNMILAVIGIEFPELFLAGAEEKLPAGQAGLKEGDRILSIDGQTVTSFEQIASIVKTYGERAKDDATPKPMAVAFLRDGKEQTVSLWPKLNERMNATGNEVKRFEIGIRPLIVDALPMTVDLKASNPFAALQRGTQLTAHWTSLTVLSFVRLFQAKVSPKNIGGFLSIGAMAKRSWQIGPAQFLIMMGIISINLFILNLFPVPVLDGGHLVFYSIEAVKGAPLSMRKMEIAQQVGLVLLLVLMVFAFYNDVTRFFVKH